MHIRLLKSDCFSKQVLIYLSKHYFLDRDKKKKRNDSSNKEETTDR